MTPIKTFDFLKSHDSRPDPKIEALLSSIELTAWQRQPLFIKEIFCYPFCEKRIIE